MTTHVPTPATDPSGPSDPSVPVDPAERPDSPPAMVRASPSPRRWRWRWRWLRILIAFVVTILLSLAGATVWALDRYVWDEVEIAGVSAYEQDQVAGTSAVGDAGADADATDTGDATGSSAAPEVTITTVVTGEGESQVTYYVADVVLDDVTQLRSAFADDAFGMSIIATTSEIADSVGASFAINGDYYGFRETGIVIRNGVLYRDEGARDGLAIYLDGTMAIYDETATDGESLLADGVWQTLSFGPALVVDGDVVEGIDDVEIDTNVGNRTIQGNQPRTAIGMIAPNHFVMVVLDGRAEGYSEGVTMTGLAEIMASLGATVAYNLDGGGSSTMVSDGALVNDPLGRGTERGTSDILYIG